MTAEPKSLRTLRFRVTERGVVDAATGAVICDPSPANAESASFLNGCVTRRVLLSTATYRKKVRRGA